jgi:hypothetical protein
MVVTPRPRTDTLPTLWRESPLSLLLKVLVSAVAGAVAASASMFGLVYSQTAAPDKNPAKDEIITYGDK